MSFERDDLEFGELAAANEALAAQQKAKRMRAFKDWALSEPLCEAVNGSLLEERYGLDSPEDDITKQEDENWRRSLAHVAMTHSLVIADADLLKTYSLQRHTGFYLNTSKYLKPLPKSANDRTFVTEHGRFEAEFKPVYEPVDLQVAQMRQQLEPATAKDHEETKIHTDKYDRYVPYSFDIPYTVPRNGMEPGYLMNVNSGVPLLIPGIDYDTAKSVMYDPAIDFSAVTPKNPTEVLPLVRAALTRIEKKLFDPKLTTFASIDLHYGPLTDLSQAPETAIKVVSPKLPATQHAKSLKYDLRVLNYFNGLQPLSRMERMLGKSDHAFKTVFEAYVEGDPDAGYPEATRLLTEQIRPVAEKHLYPHIDTYRRQAAEKIARILDLIEK